MTAPTRERILEAAERHVRAGGYNGFSFRDLATEIGIKSASVHYHFPSKETLVAELAARYRERFLAGLPAPSPDQPALPALRAAFRAALHRDGLMCLCGALASQTEVLPPPVATEARAFFEALLVWLDAGLTGSDVIRRQTALASLAQLEGAMLLARTLEDPRVFDDATAELA